MQNIDWLPSHPTLPCYLDTARLLPAAFAVCFIASIVLTAAFPCGRWEKRFRLTNTKGFVEKVREGEIDFSTVKWGCSVLRGGGGKLLEVVWEQKERRRRGTVGLNSSMAGNCATQCENSGNTMRVFRDYSKGKHSSHHITSHLSTCSSSEWLTFFVELPILPRDTCNDATAERGQAL